MTLLETITFIADQTYYHEDGEAYSVALLPPMSVTEIAEFQSGMPENHLPEEVKEMLLITRGIEHPFLDEVSFDRHTSPWQKELLPKGISLATDGRGNDFWIDILPDGSWGSVLFIDHDPPVLMRFSLNLQDFFMLLHEDMTAEVDCSFFSKLYSSVEIAIHNAGEEIKPKGDATTLPLPPSMALPEYYRIETIEEENSGFVLEGGYSSFAYKIPGQLTWIIEVSPQKDFWGRRIPGKFGPRRSLLIRLLKKIIG
jgi:hypothetical protein